MGQIHTLRRAQHGPQKPSIVIPCGFRLNNRLAEQRLSLWCGAASAKRPFCPRVKQMSIDLTRFRDLPVADKLRVITELWDDIASSDDPIVVPSEFMSEAVRRSDELTADPSISIG